VLLDPESPHFSPHVLLSVAFGEVIGLKLYAILMAMAGAAGMYAFLRTRTLSRTSSAFGSLGLVLSTWLSCREHSGNFTEFPFVLFPVLTLALHYRSKGRALLAAGLLFATMIADGKLAVPVIALMLLVYAVTSAVGFSRRRVTIDTEWTKGALVVLLTGALLAAGRLMLVAKLFWGYSAHVLRRSDIYAAAWVLAYSPRAVLNALIHVYSGHGKETMFSGLFVGPVLLILGVFGLVCAWRRTWRLLVIGVMGFAFVSAQHFPVDVFRLLYIVPPFSLIQAPSKYFDFFILFSLVSIAAEGMSVVERTGGQWRRWTVHAGVLLGLVPLAAASVWVGEHIYTLPPEGQPEKERFQQVYGVGMESGQRRPSNADMYRNLRRGVGTIDFQAAVRLPTHAVPALFIRRDGSAKRNPDYRGEVVLSNGKGSAKLEMLSPNRLVVHVALERPSVLIVNQNFDSGWRSNVGRPFPSRGLLSVRVDQPGERDVVFHYCPIFDYVALFCSAAALGVWVGIWIYLGRRPGGIISRLLGASNHYITYRWNRRRSAVGVLGTIGLIAIVCGTSIWLRKRDEVLYSIYEACSNGRFQRVVQLFMFAPPSVQSHPLALRAAGYSFLCLGRPKQALENYLRLLERTKPDTDLMNGMGLAYLISGDIKKAEVWLDRAIALDPYAPEAYVLRAAAYSEVGKTKEARHMFDRALLRGADSPEVWRSLVLQPLLRRASLR